MSKRVFIQHYQLKKSEIVCKFHGFLQYADGTNSLEKISKIIRLELKLVKKIYSTLLRNNLITS